MSKIMVIGNSWELEPMTKKIRFSGMECIVSEKDPKDLLGLEKEFLELNPDAVISDECDYSMYAVAYLTEKYNLPGPGLRPLTITTNKYLQRVILTNGEDVLQPIYEVAWDYSQLETFASIVGFPLIVKPTSNRGSIGVSLVEDESELVDAWYKAIANSSSGQCIVEEFIPGDMLVVDGFYDSISFKPISLSHKIQYDSFTVSKALYFPSVEFDHLRKKAFALTKSVVETLGITWGFVHCEMIYSSNDKSLYFIEVANRGGGVHTSNLILPAITGIDFPNVLLQMSLGKKVNLSKLWDGKYKSKVLMYFMSPTGSFSPTHIFQEYRQDIICLYMNKYTNVVGSSMDSALGREGVVILEGDDHEEMLKLAKQIEKEIKHSFTPIHLYRDVL